MRLSMRFLGISAFLIRSEDDLRSAVRIDVFPLCLKALGPCTPRCQVRTLGVRPARCGPDPMRAGREGRLGDSRGVDR